MNKTGYDGMENIYFIRTSIMLILMSADYCPFCKQVEAFIEENNIDVKIINSPKGDISRNIMEKLGEKQQIPFLIDFHEGKWMFDSTAIIDYLNKNYT